MEEKVLFVFYFFYQRDILFLLICEFSMNFIYINPIFI